jgi:glycosyltransferase involved in cell wall biosynthesis
LNGSPLVTIVVPVYSHLEFLPECLQSITAQTMPDWEAVVVDDGAPDGDPGAVVRALADARVRLIRHDRNRGLAAARNTGIRAGTGRYVLPVDGDDLLAPTFLEAVIGRLGDTEAHDAVFTEFMAFGAGPSVRLRYHVRDIKALLTVQWIPGAGTLFRRALWERIGGYCEADALRPGNEDWDFWLAAAEYGLQTAHHPEPLYMYRQHATSMMQGLAYHDYSTREFICQRHEALFDRYGMKNVFLSRGYFGSAKAHWRRSQPADAIRLAVKSFQLEPLDFGRRLVWHGNRWLRRRWSGDQHNGEIE